MFHNKRKTIALFAEFVGKEYSQQLCQAVEKKTKELGYNLAVFSGFGKYGDNPEYLKGDNAIYDLPDYENFAGVIMALDTILDIPSRQAVYEKIRKLKCPVVSLRVDVSDANVILVDNTTSMEGIIHHMVKAHGLRKICFMSGPKAHIEAVQREECFERVMKELAIPYDDHCIFWGDFWENMAAEAVDWFFYDGRFPEAIICANDYMAIAVISELIKRGYNVPRHIAVTGYDGIMETLFFTPSVSTVDVPFYDMGKKAVEIIHEKQNCPDKLDKYYVDTVLELRESCGCMRGSADEIVLVRRNQHELARHSENTRTQFDFMSIDLSGCDNIEELHSMICRYIFNMEGIKNYALCLKKDVVNRQEDDFESFDDEMEVRVALKDRIDLGSVKIPFEKKELVPELLVDDTPQTWYFTPVHFKDLNFGYEAFSYGDVSKTAEIHLHWSVNIGNQVRNIRVHNKMQGLISKLESMYDRDELTKMYNRRGFESRGGEIFAYAKDNQKPLFLAVIDLDGMKQINDNYGHVEGDFALKYLADMLLKLSSNTCVAARTGGDEFVIVATDIKEQTGVAWLQDLEGYLGRFNESGKKDYNIYASSGHTYRVPKNDDSLETFVKESDEFMYNNKIKNKIRRGQMLR